MDEFVAVDGWAGPLFAAWNRRGVSFVTLTDDVTVFAERFTDHFHRPLRAASRRPVELMRALETGRVPASLRLDLDHLRPFARAVLEATRRIPYGEVRTYAWVAKEAGHPAAVRAAGTALSCNPVAFLVPCHRVIRSDGTVGHYGFGTDIKRALLMAEGVDFFKPSPLEVKTGTKVTWTNEDQILHTVTAGAPGNPTGTFDQEMPDRGAVFSFTFERPGTFPYFCQRHNSMTGTVTVT